MSDLIYLDNATTARVDSKVVEAMLPYFTEDYGNASSRHIFGSNANKGVKKARERVSVLIGCDEREVIFTSGATEDIGVH